jgi:hypothetical protein
MNTQLVESIAQLIDSLSSEEKSLLASKLYLSNENWEAVFLELQENWQKIKDFQQSQLFSLSIEDMVHQMREERTQELIDTVTE